MLAICGDSFSYGTTEETWPKILADKLNLPLTNLSLVGGSNYSICFQLDYLLNNYNPKLIIISLTSSIRFEKDKDEYGNLADISDFNYKIDEVKTSPFSKKPSITSGNTQENLSRSFRLESQYQSWCIQHLISKIKCDYLLYRNIYPRFHKDINKYKNECFYGLEKLYGWRNNGPYNYEKEHLKGNESTNHLSLDENIKFAEHIVNEL